MSAFSSLALRDIIFVLFYLLIRDSYFDYYDYEYYYYYYFH